MTKLKRKDEFNARLEALWKYLSENANQELRWDDTKSIIEARTHTSNLSDVQLEYCIRRLREGLHTPNEIKIVGADPTKGKDAKKDARVVLHLRESDSKRRERRATEQKKQIAAAVWHTILGKPSEESDSEDVPHVVMPAVSSWPDGTIQRLLSLRRRSFASVALDSGSTIRAVIRHLINAPSMPFRAYSAPFHETFALEAPGYSTLREVLPTIITNSPLVATDILDSQSYNQMDVRLIGGNVGGDSAATTGILAESCLAAWGYLGQFVGVDVAIVGTRGYKIDGEGQKAFMVSHLSQANIKARFFGMAATKCIVMDSNKLRDPDGVCRFARLDSSDVHVVFTDSECRKEVISFFASAVRRNVVPVVATKNLADAKELATELRIATPSPGEVRYHSTARQQ